MQNIASGMIPRIYNHSYAISADVVIPEGGAEGVIVAEADHLGGFSLFVADGKLKHTYSMMGVLVYRQESDTTLPTGEVTCGWSSTPTRPQPATGGDIRLFANGQEIGKGRMDHTVPLRFSGYAGMDIGRDNGGVVDRNYANQAPFAFTGTIKKVVFDLKPHLSGADEQALHEWRTTGTWPTASAASTRAPGNCPVPRLPPTAGSREDTHLSTRMLTTRRSYVPGRRDPPR